MIKKKEYKKVEREEDKKISEEIKAYLIENNLERVKTKDMMPFLIEKGYFPHDRKKGYPLRQILTDLKKSEELHLLPQACPEYLELENKKTSTYWYFSPVK